jgi:hypothetical protein
MFKPFQIVTCLKGFTHFNKVEKDLPCLSPILIDSGEIVLFLGEMPDKPGFCAVTNRRNLVYWDIPMSNFK